MFLYTLSEDSMSVVSDQAELQAGNRNTTPTQRIIDDAKSIPEEISQLIPTSVADPEMEQEQDLVILLILTLLQILRILNAVLCFIG